MALASIRRSSIPVTWDCTPCRSAPPAWEERCRLRAHRGAALYSGLVFPRLPPPGKWVRTVGSKSECFLHLPGKG